MFPRCQPDAVDDAPQVMLEALVIIQLDAEERGIAVARDGSKRGVDIVARNSNPHVADRDRECCSGRGHERRSRRRPATAISAASARPSSLPRANQAALFGHLLMASDRAASIAPWRDADKALPSWGREKCRGNPR